MIAWLTKYHVPHLAGVYIASTGFFSIGIQFFYLFLDNKQWNKIALYSGVSKAIFRTTLHKVGFCHLQLLKVLHNISQQV